jgi:hypothetical protein
MNDERKFRRIHGNFEDTYPNYYGAGLVTIVLRIAASMKSRQLASWFQNPAEHEKFGLLSRLFPALLNVLSAPKGDHEGPQRGAPRL